MRRLGTTPPSQQCYDLGVEKVEVWLEDWLGPNTLISLRRFEINADSLLPRGSGFIRTNAYRKAFTKNQSLLHGHLKYLALRWLELEPATANDGTEPDYEVKMYFPEHDLLKGFNFRSPVGYFDIEKAQLILPKGRGDVDASFGRTTFADVLGKFTSIEVGRTSPMNLCMPLLEKLVQRSIWIPLPTDKFTKKLTLRR